MTPNFFPEWQIQVCFMVWHESGKKRKTSEDLTHYFEIDTKFMWFKANLGVQNSAEVV